MNETTFALIIILEIVFSSFIVWGILNENKLIKFERNLYKIIKEFFNNKIFEFIVRG